MEISFVRHGITDWNEEGRIQGSVDTSLNDRGIEMSKRLATRLKDYEWDVIFTSPAKRARQTAQIIAHDDHPHTAFIIDNRLKEISEGILEGMTEAERLQQWGEDWQQPYNGRETRHSIHTRAQSFLDELARSEVRSILIVSHGSFIYEMLLLLKVITPEVEELQNCSLTTITYDEYKLCTKYNCIRHLL